jgi:hypothetical protein
VETKLRALPWLGQHDQIDTPKGWCTCHWQVARLRSTYVELPTNPPQSAYVDFTHTQGEKPMDRQLAAQPLEGPQDSTALTLSKLSHEEQQSLCEQLQLIRDQLAQTSLILDMMDQCDEVHDKRFKLFEHTGESVTIQ